jgi:hypothetical protein
LSRPTNETTV